MSSHQHSESDNVPLVTQNVGMSDSMSVALNCRRLDVEAGNALDKCAAAGPSDAAASVEGQDPSHSHSHQMDIRGPMLAFLSASLFGVSPALAKVVVQDMEPLMLAGLMYLGSGLGLLAFMLFKGEPAPPIWGPLLEVSGGPPIAPPWTGRRALPIDTAVL